MKILIKVMENKKVIITAKEVIILDKFFIIEFSYIYYFI